MKNYFITAVKDLQMNGFKDESIYDEKRDNINRSITKFNKHPSIIKIKEDVVVRDKNSFSKTNLKNIEQQIVNLNIKEATTLNNKS